MISSLLKPIIEMSYLNAQNVGRYRCIMRFFYDQHQRLRYWLKPQEVYGGVIALGLLEDDYTLEQCQKDLGQLVEWNNLVPRHDGGRSATVEEYLRKKFRYQMTPYAVEIERLVAGLEKIRGYGGSLEPSLFENIAASLDRLENLYSLENLKNIESPESIDHPENRISPGEAISLWEKLYGDFVKLTENASDYIASLQSSKVEELMLTEAFLIYKESVTRYLQDFIQGLQRYAYKIEAVLATIRQNTVEAFLGSVKRDFSARPQLDEPLTPEEQLEKLRGEWQSLVRWFAGFDGEHSDVYFLEQTTKDTIARIVRNALRIQEKHRLGVSRRRELDYLGKWFFSLEELGGAHRLAAHVFALYRCRHFQGLDEKNTDNTEISMWHAGPNIRELRSRSRKRLRESGTAAIREQHERQQKTRKNFLLARQEEAAQLQQYLAREEIRISELEELSARERHYLLYWIGRCLANKSRRILTPEGIGIGLAMPAGGDRALLKCDYLLEAQRSLNKAQLKLEAALEEEEEKNSVLREIIIQLQKTTSRLHEYMSGWNIPKAESALMLASEQMSTYRQYLGELKSAWTEHKNVLSSLATVTRDLQEAQENQEVEEAELAALREQLRTVQHKIEVYEQLLQELGIAHIDRELERLEKEQKVLARRLDELNEEIGRLKVNLALARKETEDVSGQLEEKEALLGQQTAGWLSEWNRRLISAWDEVIFDPAETPDLFRAAGQAEQRYRERFSAKTHADFSDQLYDAFHNTRQALHDYAPETVKEEETGRLLVLFTKDRQNPIPPHLLVQELKELEEEQRHLLSQKDRELYEQIILHSVGKAIKDKIYRAEKWVRQMNSLMGQRETTSGLRLHLKWEPRGAANERELDTTQLVRLLKTDPRQLRNEHTDQMIEHFRSRISRAKMEADEHDTLRRWIFLLLDYRQWFRFTLYYEKGEQTRRELTDARFNVLSGGEKALAMYIPLFAAANSRYNDSRKEAPRIISLDEAFAGVDDENMRDMFELLTHLDFDYMMTSQVLWGCYDTVPKLSIYELYRPLDVNYVTLIHYFWNGSRRMLMDDSRIESKIDSGVDSETGSGIENRVENGVKSGGTR